MGWTGGGVGVPRGNDQSHVLTPKDLTYASPSSTGFLQLCPNCLNIIIILCHNLTKAFMGHIEDHPCATQRISHLSTLSDGQDKTAQAWFWQCVGVAKVGGCSEGVRNEDDGAVHPYPSDMSPKVHYNLCNHCYTLEMPDQRPDIRCVQYLSKVH